MEMNKPIVLCIPRANSSVTEQQVRKTFNDLNLGKLDKIHVRDALSSKGEQIKRIFIHYNEWNESENAQIAKERLSNDKDIKVIYDGPWYWKVVSYKGPEMRKKKVI